LKTKWRHFDQLAPNLLTVLSDIFNQIDIFNVQVEFPGRWIN